MLWRGLICAALACLASAASGQPAHAPSHFDLVDTAGNRQRLVVDRGELSLLPPELKTRDVQMPRATVRMICAWPCPETLPARRPREDVIAWQDGRRTRGPVFVYRDIVEQGGERAGRLEDIRTIELGTARLDRRVVRGLEPQVVEAYWFDPWDGGEFVVFRQPWVTLSEREIIFHGRPAIPRGGNLRSIRLEGEPERGDWPDQDLVVWQDGTRTTGPVTITGGFVEQPGRPRRAFREVAYIELARH